MKEKIYCNSNFNLIIKYIKIKINNNHNSNNNNSYYLNNNNSNNNNK